MRFSKAHIAEIIDETGLEHLTAKSVRIRLEEQLGLEPGSLKSKKSEIAGMIDAVLNEQVCGVDE